MTKDLSRQLQVLCPLLYQDMFGNPLKTGLNFGIEAPDGWFELIKKLSLQLEDCINKLSEEEKLNCKALQCKEKFGMLRFYLQNSTEEMKSIIDIAEKESQFICQVCGKDGLPIENNGWIFNSCQEHIK